MFRLLADGSPLSGRKALTLLQNDPSFRNFFSALLSDTAFDAFRMEWPPLTIDTAGEALEFVLVRDIALARRADSAAFAEQLVSSKPVAGFANLGRDAFLIVPSDPGGGADYSHLAAFLRNAPQAQIDALWQRVGNATALRLTDRPIWLNTAGGGVPWLHVRLDTRPKYYTFAPYRRAPRS